MDVQSLVTFDRTKYRLLQPLWHQGRVIELARAPLPGLENWEQGLDKFDLRSIQALLLGLYRVQRDGHHRLTNVTALPRKICRVHRPVPVFLFQPADRVFRFLS